MSEYTRLLDMVQDEISESNSADKNQPVTKAEDVEVSPVVYFPSQTTNIEYMPFDVNIFIQELAEKSDIKKRSYIAENANAYDIASNCIRQIIYKLNNTPVKSYADKWLPVAMRSTLGSAVHDFIQSSNQFTEKECSIKVPSIYFSGRLDCLIGPEILVEIKSCTYKDYQSIIKKQRPRISDFYQTFTYKHVIENYLEEIKNCPVSTRTKKPMLDKYEIKKVQYIYVAHDIMTSDIEDFGQMLQTVDDIKKALNSKSNSFYFMSSLVLDLTSFDNKPYLDYVAGKLAAIKLYMTNNKLPDNSDPYIDKKGCFFCMYRDLCEIR